MTPRLHQPLHSAMGTAVLERLRLLAPLPASGVVAGQAVASALEDIYGRGGGVYNDVDVFRQIHPNVPLRMGANLLVPTVDGQTLAVSLQLPPNHEYDAMLAERQLVPTLTSYRTYSVAATLRKDLLNLVFYRAGGRANSAPRMVIQGFDLNCVRVGVDLATQQLCWDRYFEEFLRTSEVRIVAGQTPLHSFMRLLKKHRELPEVSANVEASAALTWLLRRPAMRELQSTRDATFWFGEKYCELARSLEPELKPYFELEEHWLQRNAKGELIRADAGDELTVGVSLGTLAARGSLEGLEDVTPHEKEQLNPHVLPGQVYRSFERKASGIVVPAAAWLKKVLPSGWSELGRNTFGVGYFDGLTNLKDVRRLEKLIPDVPGELFFDRPAVEVLKHVDSLDAALTELNVPDKAHVRELALYLVTDTPKMAVESVLQRERSQALSILGVPLTVSQEVWAGQLPTADARVVLLRNMREAREFAHSVGWDDSFEDVLRLDGVLVGAWGGRNKRDAALYWYQVDEATKLLDWHFRVHKRFRMPVALERSHALTCAALFNAFRSQGAVVPFRSKS